MLFPAHSPIVFFFAHALPLIQIYHADVAPPAHASPLMSAITSLSKPKPDAERSRRRASMSTSENSSIVRCVVCAWSNLSYAKSMSNWSDLVLSCLNFLYQRLIECQLYEVCRQLMVEKVPSPRCRGRSRTPNAVVDAPQCRRRRTRRLYVLLFVVGLS